MKRHPPSPPQAVVGAGMGLGALGAGYLALTRGLPRPAKPSGNGSSSSSSQQRQQRSSSSSRSDDGPVVNAQSKSLDGEREHVWCACWQTPSPLLATRAACKHQGSRLIKQCAPRPVPRPPYAESEEEARRMSRELYEFDRLIAEKEEKRRMEEWRRNVGKDSDRRP